MIKYWKRLKGNIIVFLFGKVVGLNRYDIHERPYKYVYEKFGHEVMLKEYLYEGNSWRLPQYFIRI